MIFRILQRNALSIAALLAVATTTRASGAQPSPEASPSPRPIVVEKAIATTESPELPPAPVAVTVPAEHHAWARFAVGSWRSLQTTSETFDENGKFLLRSQTLHTDTLTAVTSETYTIESTSVVDVGGKRLRGATQTVTRSLWSEHCDTPPLVRRLPPADISLTSRTIPCQRWELSLGEGAQRRLETIYYSPDFSPNFLRRELSAADSGSPSDVTSMTSSLISVDVPILIDGGMIAGWQVQIKSTAGVNTTERMELQCDRVPGALVSATATERDATGRRVRWVVTELEDFGLPGDEPKSGPRWRLLFRRGR